MGRNTNTQSTTTSESITTESGESPNIKIAVMNNDIKHINDTLARMETKFDNVINSFVTTDKLTDLTTSITTKNTQQDKAITLLENWNMWAVRIVLGAVLIAGVGLLIANGKIL